MPADKTVQQLVRDATAAPSMHNAQPWRFRFLRASGTLELRADPKRAMPASDPAHRALHIGCGAALFNLRVAAAHAGRLPRARLLPDHADPGLLATVDLSGSPLDGPDDGLARLYPAIHRRHTSRYPFAEQGLSDAERAALTEAADREGAVLLFPSDWHLEVLLDLVHDAEGRDGAEPARQEEVARWTQLGAAEADTASEGVPEYAFGPHKRDGRAPVRDFAGRRPVADRGTTTFESHPNLALLGTADDRPADWLRAGQALERVLLQATLDGLATSLTSHALEWSDLRELVRDPASAVGFVQMVLRVGHGPQGPTTRRRPVREVLEFE
ncbi:Acg family FMN-binding oxidoreductase [Streptomyces flavofungini]|uniref:Nitroreductase n=1 Tax=Streptomyces flavofungini TaxID=68200 RepID=A0ABS0XIH0_9ACTN|nr:nitroreductase [Streptomyces flavofungini]MBJ3812975.1 nitroreductase [Streptomyces flavofungini]GHC84249.1 nitroreductase [Streptomyces flavofungini]